MRSDAQKRGGFFRLFLFAAGSCALLAACSGNSSGTGASPATSPPGGFPVFVNIPEPPTLVADFSASPMEILQEGGRSTYTITLNRPVPPRNSPLSFTYKTTEVSSGMEAPVENPNDHRVDGTFIVGPGSRSDFIVLDSRESGDYDGSFQTITLTLNPLPTNGDGVRLQLGEGVSGTSTVTIWDLHPTPTRVNEFTVFPDTIGSDGHHSTVMLRLNHEVPPGYDALSFPYVLTGAVDFAAPGTPTAGDMVIAAGSDNATLTITSAAHVEDRGPEGIITITLGALPKNADGNRLHFSDGARGAITLTIADAVPRPTLVTEFAASPPIISENGSQSTIMLRLNHPVPANDGRLSFPYAITGAAGYYNPIPATGVIHIEKGSNLGSFVVTSRDGGEDLGERRTMTVTLGNLPSNADGDMLQFADAVSGTARLTIVDSGTPRPTMITGFSVAPTEISITRGRATITLTLNRILPATDPAIAFPYRVEYRDNLSDFYLTNQKNNGVQDLIVLPGRQTGTLVIKTTHVEPSPIQPRDMSVVLEALPQNIANTPIRLAAGTPDKVTITIFGSGGPPSRMSLARRVGALAETFALSTADAHAGMIVQDVRRRINAADPPQKTAVGLARLPDQGGAGDLLPAMSLHTGGTLDSGHRYAMWLKPLTQTISAGTGGDLSGGDMTGAGLGIEWQSADGRLLQGLTASLMSSGMAVSGGPVRGAEWSEDMIVVAPYAVRRSGSANLWLSGGIGAGSAALAGAGVGSGDGESRLTFINGGAEWSGAVFSGPQMTVEAQGSLIRKDISGFRLKGTDVPNVSAGIARTEGAAVMHWPLGLADGVIAPHMALDFSADAGDVLPGHDRHAAAMRSSLNWSRDALSVFAQASRALSGADADAAATTDDLSAGMRLELWEDVGLDLQTARESATGDDAATVHRARIAGRWEF